MPHFVSNYRLESRELNHPSDKLHYKLGGQGPSTYASCSSKRLNQFVKKVFCPTTIEWIVRNSLDITYEEIEDDQIPGSVKKELKARIYYKTRYFAQVLSHVHPILALNTKLNWFVKAVLDLNDEDGTEYSYIITPTVSYHPHITLPNYTTRIDELNQEFRSINLPEFTVREDYLSEDFESIRLYTPFWSSLKKLYPRDAASDTLSWPVFKERMKTIFESYPSGTVNPFHLFKSQYPAALKIWKHQFGYGAWEFSHLNVETLVNENLIEYGLSALGRTCDNPYFNLSNLVNTGEYGDHLSVSEVARKINFTAEDSGSEVVTTVVLTDDFFSSATASPTIAWAYKTNAIFCEAVLKHRQRSVGIGHAPFLTLHGAGSYHFAMPFNVYTRTENYNCFLLDPSETTHAEEHTRVEPRRTSLLNYTYDVLQDIPKDSYTPSKLSKSYLYGVELEVSSKVPVQVVVNSTKENFFICKSDTSITGSNEYPFEIVTTPAPLKVQKKYWYQMFDKVGHGMFDQSRQTRNGMHVHIDKKGFCDRQHFRNFIWFWGNQLNRPFFSTIAERDPSTFDSYAKPMSYLHGQKDLKLDYKNAERTWHEYGRYDRCILAQKTHSDGGTTIEVRAFKGVANIGSVYKNLEMVEASLEFTKQCQFKTNNINSFLAWLNATHKSRFRYLKQFLSLIDLHQELEIAKLNELLVSTKNFIANHKKKYFFDKISPQDLNICSSIVFQQQGDNSLIPDDPNYVVLGDVAQTIMNQHKYLGDVACA